MSASESSRGPIAWMVHNRVTPNIIMWVLLVGGLLMLGAIKQEVFPEFALDQVTISVAYPGASPAEVEQGLILAIEESVRGLDGVKQVLSKANEGRAELTVELTEGADRQKAYQEVQQQVGRIRTFPAEAERPLITLAARRNEVLSLLIYGRAEEGALRELAEQMRERLLQTGRVTQIDLKGARALEVACEIPQAALRAHGLTLDEVARRIAASAVELPGGGVKTRAGEVLIRFRERRDWARQFAELPIIATPDGGWLKLADLGSVRESFAEVDEEAYYDGQRAIGLDVFRVGAETPMGVSAAVREALAEISADLPEGVRYVVHDDRSEIFRQRLELLLKNGAQGLLVVFVLLALFLQPKVAFWVTLGVPTSVLGAMLFLPLTDFSINMISLFAFIITLGIVVDDAIVVGENVHEYRRMGLDPSIAAIRGTREVGSPVAFSVLTNIVSFVPLAFVPGWMGKVWGIIPVIVAVVFLISWAESIFILPAHLAHMRTGGGGLLAFLGRAQERFADGFSRVIARRFGPFIRLAARARYLTVAAGLALLLVSGAWAFSGRMGFVLMPKVESDRSQASARLPYGSPLSQSRRVCEALTASARRMVAEGGGERLSTGISSSIKGELVEVSIHLTDPETRPITTTLVTDRWRAATGELAGLESLRFEADRGGPGGGPGVTVEISHADIALLDRASATLAERLAEYPPVRDVDDGYTPGKPQFDFELGPEGRSLGLRPVDVARQVRAAFYGAEALRQQRGRNEVKVMVRLPAAERESEYDIERLLVRAPSGRDVPLAEIASARRARAYTRIDRRDGRRTISVSANVEPAKDVNQVLASLKEEVLPRLARDFPGLAYGFEGRQAEMRDALAVLKWGSLLALLAIYILLAIPFRSYVQPAIVMVAIPFGCVGALGGHVLMGYDLSVISLFGIIALAGVVVNDALVMMDYANGRRALGESAFEAICNAGVRRFRPIMLTTLTTFGGLAPMIFETSRQARFMIPMAISLGYGILFATAITLVIVPCLYLIIEDLKEL